jgi:putative component of toxin-antitoxin plasmid stabilization module
MDVLRTSLFEKRLLEIADAKARSRVNIAAQRMRAGNFGDSKSVGPRRRRGAHPLRPGLSHLLHVSRQ